MTALGKRTLRLVTVMALASVMTVAHAQAASLTAFTSDCGAASYQFVVSDSGALGLTVTGPVSGSLQQEGTCTVSWTATRILTLDPGFYAVGTIIDFDWALQATFNPEEFGFAFLSWDIQQGLLGTAANIALSDTIFWAEGSESGNVTAAADTSLFPKYFEVTGGEMTFEQTGTLTFNLIGGSLFAADLDFPVTSYLVQVPEPPPPPVPEPTTALIFASGVAGFFARRRKIGN